MKIFEFKSIRTRLTYWFLLLTLIPLLVVLTITYFQRVDVIKNQAIDKLTAIRDLKVEQLDLWLEGIVADMNTVSNNDDLKRVKYYTENNNDNIVQSRIQNYLINYVKNYNAYYDFSIINPIDGKIMVSTQNSLEGYDVSDNEYFTKPMLTRKLSIKDIYYSKMLGEYTMAYSIPIFDPMNKDIIVGILVARIDLNNSLYPLLLDRVGLGNTGETLIVNEDVFALNILRWHGQAPLKLKITAMPARNAALGKTGILQANDYRGEEVLAAYSYIPVTKWGFVCKQDMNELDKPIDELIVNSIIIFLIVSLLITILSINLSKSIAKNIVAMNLVAQKMRSGDFSVRNKITSDDELGSLALEFNNMADITESRIAIQQGISSITEVMIGRSSMKDFGLALLKELKKITEANICTFFILNEAVGSFEHLVSIGANKELLDSFDSSLPEGDFGNAFSSKSIYYLQNIPANTKFKYKTVSGAAIPKELITIPILVENTVVAFISIAKISSFSVDCHDIINQSWDSINTAYSNLISSERTKVFADHLSRMNLQLELKSKELEKQTSEMKVQAEELHNASRELQIQNIELESQKKQVMTANKLKSEFLSNMSHELRTPLNSIMALSNVLITDSKSKLNDDEANYLTIIERNGKRLLSLINDILDLSKIEAGKMEIIPDFISVENLLQLVIENIQSISDKKGLTTNLKYSENLPRVQSDESRLYQVVLNIVSNAIKFTEEGRIDVSIMSDEENVIITVADTGIGISENVLPHIFDEFHQADGTSSRRFEGTGLGLAIAKKMMYILGGEISVESELGKGSTFTISLPIVWHLGRISDSNKSKQIFQNENYNNTVLIIDDDLQVIEELSFYLQQAGYDTISATSGKKAIELANKYQPIAITLDIVMPEMDGWEVLQNLKASKQTTNIPVIIVSVADDRETGLALGAVSFINKPIDNVLLISEIRKIKNKPSTVMLVDDNEMELKQMTKLLDSENIPTLSLSSGEECLENVHNTIPDILVLDLMMPGMDGFQVLHQIRRNPKTKNLPVIVVTAKELTSEDKKRLAGNVASIISKSESTSIDLYKEIKRIIDGISKFKNPAKETSRIRSIEKSKANSNDIFTQPSILIIEDNPDNMITIKAILKGNYNIWEAKDGEEGLKFIEINKPDLILLDMSLPDISGEEIVRILKTDDNTNNIPVIAVTAQAMIGDREIFINLGCDNYISKPIDKDELNNMVAKYLEN